MYDVKVSQGGQDLFRESFNADSVYAALTAAAEAAKPVPPSIWGFHVHIEEAIKAVNDEFLTYGSRIPMMICCLWRSIGNPHMPIEHYPQVEYIKRAHAAGKKNIVRMADCMHYSNFYRIDAYREARAKTDIPMGPFTAVALGKFNAWVYEALKVLHPYIYGVQFWNEIAELGGGGNYLISWNGERIESFYTETIMGYTYRWFKSLYPELKFLMPAIGNPHSNSRAHAFLSACFQRGIARWTDGFNVHRYNSYDTKGYYKNLFEQWNWPDVYVTECNRSGGADWAFVRGIRDEMVRLAGDRVKVVAAYSLQEPPNSSEPQLTSKQFMGEMK